MPFSDLQFALSFDKFYIQANSILYEGSVEQKKILHGYNHGKGELVKGYCSRYGDLIFLTENRKGQSCLRLDFTYTPEMLSCGNDNYRWNKNLSVAFTIEHFIVVNPNPHSASLHIVSLNGEFSQHEDLPIVVPDSNAVCVVDKCESFIVVSKSPVSLFLFRFNKNKYILEDMISREELGLNGHDDERILCHGISSLNDTVDDTLCIALSRCRQFSIDYLLFYRLNVITRASYVTDKQLKNKLKQFVSKAQIDDNYRG